MHTSFGLHSFLAGDAVTAEVTSIDQFGNIANQMYKSPYRAAVMVRITNIFLDESANILSSLTIAEQQRGEIVLFGAPCKLEWTAATASYNQIHQTDWPRAHLAMSGYRLKAYTDGTDALDTAYSDKFEVRPNVPSMLLFHGGPAQVVAGELFDPSPWVGVADRFGNEILTAELENDHIIEVQLCSATASNDTLATELIGSKSAGLTDGIARFDALTVLRCGSFVLRASTALLSGALSASFDVVAAHAAWLVFVHEPAISIVAGEVTSVHVRVKTLSAISCRTSGRQCCCSYAAQTQHRSARTMRSTLASVYSVVCTSTHRCKWQGVRCSGLHMPTHSVWPRARSSMCSPHSRARSASSVSRRTLWWLGCECSHRRWWQCTMHSQTG